MYINVQFSLWLVFTAWPTSHTKWWASHGVRLKWTLLPKRKNVTSLSHSLNHIYTVNQHVAASSLFFFFFPGSAEGEEWGCVWVWGRIHLVYGVMALYWPCATSHWPPPTRAWEIPLSFILRRLCRVSTWLSEGAVNVICGGQRELGEKQDH